MPTSSSGKQQPIVASLCRVIKVLDYSRVAQKTHYREVTLVNTYSLPLQEQIVSSSFMITA
jgi:hypothetical protein